MRKIVSLVLVVILMFSLSSVVFGEEGKSYFSDISLESEYYEATSWGVENKIIYGTGVGNYLPDSPLTFGQFCVILSRYTNNDTVESADWERELYVRSNGCVRVGWMPPAILENLSQSVPLNYACSILLFIRDIEYPNFSEVSADKNAVYFLQQIGLIGELSEEEYGFISRGDFIKLLYELDRFDANSLSYEVEYAYPEILEQFGSQIVFEGNLKTKEGERDGHKTVILKNLYLNSLSRVPESIIEDFIEEGWTLYIGEDTMSKYDGLYDLTALGITDYSNKLIAVRSPQAIVHEFGHYLQKRLNMISSFDDYYAEGKDRIKAYRDLHLYNTLEYYAVVFELYINSKYPMGINTQYAYEAFVESAPKTWKYFEDLEKNNWGMDSVYKTLRNLAQ